MHDPQDAKGKLIRVMDEAWDLFVGARAPVTIRAGSSFDSSFNYQGPAEKWIDRRDWHEWLEKRGISAPVQGEGFVVPDHSSPMSWLEIPKETADKILVLGLP